MKLEWAEADAEALPFEDDEFDVVISSIGVMLAPQHEAAAGELVRVCKPGGTIGLLSWTSENRGSDEAAHFEMEYLIAVGRKRA